ncbi:MAG: UpxY family transcription antiterminator [Dysgonamonadaceae bacterium]|jgi:transcription antitermination factor NusG|nr:UpxY family transcription antiterminator [Dysgonamonadaceae bacterium]
MKQSIVSWYVARVKYRTEKKIKKFLEQKGIEHYIPLQEDKPLIPCVVFIRTEQQQALSLPVESDYTISYIYETDTKKFQVISDKQMQDFMFLQDFSDKTFILPDPENLKGGERVRVIAGEFAGIEGELYRIRGHKRVVVRLGNFGAVALEEYVAKENLEKYELK